MPSMPSMPTSLFPAVFRSIPFEATGIDREHGVDLVTHEFTNVDAPYNEPSRRKTRRWTFRGCVTGETGPVLRDLLIAACEVKLPGILWHQNLGLADVYCVSCRPHESVEEGQFTTWFDFEFVEAGAYLPSGALVTVALAAKLGVMDAVAGIVYAATNDGDTVSQTAMCDAIKTVADTMTNRDNAEEMDGLLDDIIAQVGTLATDATAAVEAWQAVFRVIDTASDARLIVASTAEMYADAPSAFGLIVHLAALHVACDLTASEKFGVWDDAVAARDLLTEMLSTAAETITDADLFAAVTDVRGRFVAAMNESSIQLPRLTTVTQSAPIPALVLAHRMYGDATRADEILSRNAESDPLMMAGELRVLAE